MQIEDQITGPIFRGAEKVHCSRDIDKTLKQKLWEGKNPSARTCCTFIGLFHPMISNKITRKGKKGVVISYDG